MTCVVLCVATIVRTMTPMNSEKILALYSWAGCDLPGNESAVGYILGWSMAIVGAVIGLLFTIRRWPNIERRVEAARSAPAAVVEGVTSSEAPIEDYDCSIM
ncbi:unnamed protein product [Cylicocyclus nassatus]|uniref:Uncharacterized protein n=1 Tax=Cylicocyclus nassatus TaxID=53992 RepID=A0AA36GYT5_CYLNA|nr:unnamed protein product [Cylicocyclus nassatus]